MFSLTCDAHLPQPPDQVYYAWTAGWALWFADPEACEVSARIGAPFYFRVRVEGPGGEVSYHPHYGRILELIPNAYVRCSWVTGPHGTGGAETQLAITLADHPAGGTRLTLVHEGFATAAARDRHAEAWPMILAAQAERLDAVPADTWQSLRFDGTAPAGNRSMPAATFVPTRSYPDLDAAVAWLVDVLGCRERLRVPGERVQLTLGNGAVVAAAWNPASAPATGGRPPATLLVRVHDVDAVWSHALHRGATGLAAPATRPDGERQATVRDPAGHAWTLSQTVADVDPATWGAEARDTPEHPHGTYRV